MTEHITREPPLFLVTGANGFLASRVVTRLLAAGCKVRGTVRNPEEFRGPAGLEVVRASLADRASLARACQGVDTVLHIAAAMGGSGSALVHSNVVGTRNLLAAAAEAGVARFVNVSSLAVYDADFLRSARVVTEASPLEARPERRDGYCYSKVVQERVAVEAAARGGMRLVTLRPGVIYGPGKAGLGSRVGLLHPPVLIRIGGRRRLPYTFVDNCADAVVAVGLSDQASGIYNIVDDEVPTARQLIEAYRRTNGKLHVLRVPGLLVGSLSRFVDWYHRWSGGQLPAVMTPIDAVTAWRNLQYPNDRLKRDTGWRQRVGVDDALRGMTAVVS